MAGGESLCCCSHSKHLNWEIFSNATVEYLSYLWDLWDVEAVLFFPLLAHFTSTVG